MKLSYNWLREFVAFSLTPHELADLLTRLGLSVDSVTQMGEWTNVVVGRVRSCDRISGTDHLTKCAVELDGGRTLEVVCGAPNVAAGQIVPVALPGASLPGGLQIAERRVRGVRSQGMICSERELGLSDRAAGILTLGEGSERLGSPLEDLLGLPDWVYEVEVTINRGDCLSHLGAAREIAAALGLDLKPPEIRAVEGSKPTSSRVSVEIRSPDRCPRYTARMVEGVVVGRSPVWIEQRLRSLGVRPISNVVDVTNYVMLELGHPLHAFDAALVEGGTVIVRMAAPGERFTTLDGREHSLTERDLLIADRRRGIALAGIMGGLHSEIRDDTKDVLLECAYFEPTGIRFTSRDRGLSSESSRRFERGVDPEMTVTAVTHAASLISQLAGGTVLKGVVDEYPRQQPPKAICLRPDRANQLLAADIPRGEAARYLERLGCRVVDSGDRLEVSPPSWRHDLEREIDLIEEVARLFGYDNVASAPTSRVPLWYQSGGEGLWRRSALLRNALLQLGFREVITYPLISAGERDALADDRRPVRVINPISEDMAVLRTGLLPNLLKVAQRNVGIGRRDLQIFEWGACFAATDTGVEEKLRLGGLVTGSVHPESWLQTLRDVTYYDLKGWVEQFLQRARIDKVQYFYYDIPEFLSSGARVGWGEGTTGREGWMGRVSPDIAGRFDLDGPVWAFEFDGEALTGPAGPGWGYRPPPRYPAARRDLCFILADERRAEELEEVLRAHGGPHLEEVELFDVFRGGDVPAGWRSLAFHLSFRSTERTLDDAEVDRAVNALVESAVKLGARLREA